MQDPNWPFHAAQSLGYPDAMNLLTPAEAFRLRTREAQVRQTIRGTAVTIPFGHGEDVPYSWRDGCASLESR